LMNGLRQTSLYVFQGSTVIGSTITSTSSSDHELTHLCHIRLGYLSENGMTILSKKGLFGSERIRKLVFLVIKVYLGNRRVSIPI